MSSVLDHSGKEIALNNCACGAEPEYFSANGCAHEVRCRSCSRVTDLEICGGDAVDQWNAGIIYANKSAAPIRGKLKL